MSSKIGLLGNLFGGCIDLAHQWLLAWFVWTFLDPLRANLNLHDEVLSAETALELAVPFKLHYLEDLIVGFRNCLSVTTVLLPCLADL